MPFSSSEKTEKKFSWVALRFFGVFKAPSYNDFLGAFELEMNMLMNLERVYASFSMG